MVEHGGRLRRAAARYAIPLADWLDLSTGINPRGWPVPAAPAAAWARLPEDDDELAETARAYYGAPTVLPVAGSQAAIQALPELRPACRVGVLHPGYAEHAHGWRRAGHAVICVPADGIDAAIPRLDVLVLIHPNNPTGAHFATGRLLDWHARLAARGGWLLVDEAFMDVTPECSVAPHGARPGLVVLRSLGKFFGLAGARVGFVCAESPLVDRLKARLGPWAVANSSRWVATEALADRAWQDTARQRLIAASERLAALLRRHDLPPQGGSALFQWTPTPNAADIHDRLARRGILTRLFDATRGRAGASGNGIPGATDPTGLRFGLPGTETDWMRLDTALSDAVTDNSLPAGSGPGRGSDKTP